MENYRKVNNSSELAAILNISVTTISFVLNGKADIYHNNPVASQRVMDGVREMNYLPNKIARCLKLEHSHINGLVIDDDRLLQFFRRSRHLPSDLIILVDNSGKDPNTDFFIKKTIQ